MQNGQQQPDLIKQATEVYPSSLAEKPIKKLRASGEATEERSVEPPGKEGATPPVGRLPGMGLFSGKYIVNGQPLKAQPHVSSHETFPAARKY